MRASSRRSNADRAAKEDGAARRGLGPTRLLGVLAGLVVGSTALPARAQPTVDPLEELTAPGTRTTEDQALDAAEIPEPPGSPIAGEPIYPVPGAEETAERAIEGSTLQIPSRVTTRIRALDADLRSLNGLGSANVVNAVLSLLVGGLAVTLGALREPNTDELSVYLYVYGGVAAARGVLDLVLTPNASGPSIAYQHMPMSTPAEVSARLAYGENALASLAEQSLILRVLDAGLNLASGAAIIPILAAREFAFSDPLDYFVLIGAGVSLVSGIVTLIGSSPAEERWAAYQQLRARLAEERDQERNGTNRGEAADEHADEHAAFTPSTATRFGVAPTATGAYASFQLTF